MQITVNNPVRFEGVDYARGVFTVADDLGLRMVTSGAAVRTIQLDQPLFWDHAFFSRDPVTGEVNGLKDADAIVLTPASEVGHACACLGDSETANGFSGTTGDVYAYYDGAANRAWYTRGYLPWVIAYSGNSLNLLYQGGVAGERSDQIVARLATAVSFKPKILFVQFGVNDIAQLATYYGGDVVLCEDTILQNMNAVIDGAASIGAFVVIKSMTPQTSASSFSADQLMLILRVNARFRKLGAGNRVIYADTYQDFIDPVSASGYCKAGLKIDATHVNGTGGRMEGERVWNCISKHVSTAYAGISSLADSSVTDPLNKNLMSGSVGLFQGTTGTVNTGITGQAATGWTISKNGTGSGVASVVAAPDGIGNAQKVVITASASGDGVSISNLLPSPSLAKTPVGSSFVVEYYCRVTSQTNLLSIEGVLQTNCVGVGLKIGSVLSPIVGDPAVISGDTQTFILRSPPIFIPAGTTSISYMQFVIAAKFAGAGGGTLEVWRAVVNKT